MNFKKLPRKAKSGVRVLRHEGPINFGIKVLQKAQKKSPVHTNHKNKIAVKVKHSDLVKVDLGKKRTKWTGTNKKALTINWVMPPPGRGSGGHTTIFRFMRYIEQAGHTCRIYLYADGGGGSTAPIEAVMDSFPRVKAKMYWLNEGEEMLPAEAIMATSWETAYAVYNSGITAKKLYFVQDYEPYFYPVGSFYSLAENTYKMAFHGITAGNWLATKLTRDFGMKTDHFDFGADRSIYKHENNRQRKEVMFYARPFTERRGFELGVIALDIFHRKHPDYKINFIGWDVSDYEIPFPYNNLKVLETDELNAVYNRCAAGLVMSMTNMSLLPLELLSSGSIPVVNDGENNRMVSDNPFITYAAADPVSLANKLSEVVSRTDLVSYAKKASSSVSIDSWDASGAKLVKTIEKVVRAKE